MKTKLIDLLGLTNMANDIRDWVNAKFQRKVYGKGLSTYDYDKTAKDKVDAIPADPKYTDTTYEAGDGISIEDNVISATGGGGGGEEMDAISVDTTPTQSSTNLITSGGVFDSLPFLPSTMEEFENPSNPMAKFIYNLAQTSQAFIFQDTNGKWYSINSFAAKSGAFTQQYKQATANAVNIISVGCWDVGLMNNYIIDSNQPNVKYVNLIIGANVTYLDNVFNSTSVERIVLSGGMNCTKLNTIFNTKPNITSVDVRGLNTSKLQEIYRMFRLTGMTSLDLSTWDTSKIYRADAAFEAGSPYYFVDFIAPINSKIKVSVSFGTQKNLSVESVEGIITWLYDYATNIPAAYDSSQTYDNGDLVSHDNNGTTEYYINKTAITTAAAWDATKWQLVGSPSPTLTIHNTAKTAYNNVHGTDALATAVTAKGWILA